MHGYKNGKVAMMTAPIDANNNFCGFGRMKGYPKMFITTWDATKMWTIFKSGVCVKTCPTKVAAKGFYNEKKGGNCKAPLYSNGKKRRICKNIATYPAHDVAGFCLPK